jgi:hypothetical protein
MKRKDVNEIAFNILQQAIGELPVQKGRPTSEEAAELGRKGGLKGGKARAKSLKKKAKQSIARKGAAARWGKAKA